MRSVKVWSKVPTSRWISPLIDKTTVFLKNLDQIPKALNYINIFSKAFGLKRSKLFCKCELMSLHDWMSSNQLQPGTKESFVHFWPDGLKDEPNMTALTCPLVWFSFLKQHILFCCAQIDFKKFSLCRTGFTGRAKTTDSDSDSEANEVS